jgi:hypothetical protein
VDEQHDRQRVTHTSRLHDADRDVTVGSTRDGQVGDVRRGLADRAGLQLIKGRPTVLRAELEEVWRGAVGIGERLRGRLEQNGSAELR